MWIRHNGEVIDVTVIETIQSTNELKVYRTDDPTKELFTITQYAVLSSAEAEELEVTSDSSEGNVSPEDPPEDPPKDPKRNDYAVVGAFGLIVLIALLNG